jgi:hypothetical protein
VRCFGKLGFLDLIGDPRKRRAFPADEVLGFPVQLPRQQARGRRHVFAGSL